jgi:hypothetical protein
MRTLSLLTILATLLILALKAPEQSFRDAAIEAGAKALDIISSPATKNETALKEKVKTFALDEKVRALRKRVKRLKESFGKDARKSSASEGWVMPHPTLEPGPTPSPVPVADVNTAELPSLPTVSDGDVTVGETASVISDGAKTADADYGELSRLYEESARLLAGIR